MRVNFCKDGVVNTNFELRLVVSGTEDSLVEEASRQEAESDGRR